ncbi:MAG: methyltransferase [Propionicimonas sp.]|nr:methyltransferase [Propionicimonas sp.]
MWKAVGMFTPGALDQVRDQLLAIGSTLDGVERRLGPQALAGLARNSSVAASEALGDADDPQACAIRLWLLQQPVAVRGLGGLPIEALVEAGLLAGTDELRAAVELKPYGSETRSGWLCSDQTPLDGRVGRPRPDFVLGASPASTTLAQLVPRQSVDSALDLGTGCGIQTLHLADHCGSVVATDLNPRALDLARITLGLSGVEADLRLGSLYQPVAGEGFDLVVTNPPYVMSPPGGELIYREGGFEADGLMREVVGSVPLNPGGTLVVLGNWAETADRPWQERVAEWLPPGCDALALQREALDPYEYIEIWLADAGLLGTPAYLPEYRRWLRYFEASRITGVGMGWIFVRRTGSASPDIRLEEWPHSVAQPVGDAIAAHFEAIDPATWPDVRLLAAAWRCSPAVAQETIGRPGADDPEHIVLRQSSGLCRAVAVDTALAAVVGACDGDLPLGVLLAATASVLEVDPDALTADVLRRLRPLIADGFLIPEPDCSQPGRVAGTPDRFS